jgi:hypothetical protein
MAEFPRDFFVHAIVKLRGIIAALNMNGVMEI